MVVQPVTEQALRHPSSSRNQRSSCTKNMSRSGCRGTKVTHDIAIEIEGILLRGTAKTVRFAQWGKLLQRLAPQVGLEPTTLRLTA